MPKSTDLMRNLELSLQRARANKPKGGGRVSDLKETEVDAVDLTDIQVHVPDLTDEDDAAVDDGTDILNNAVDHRTSEVDPTQRPVAQRPEAGIVPDAPEE